MSTTTPKMATTEKAASPTAVAKHPTTTRISTPVPAGILIPLFTTLSAFAYHNMWYPINHPIPNAPLTLHTWCPPGATPSQFQYLPAWLGNWTVTANDTFCLLTTFFELILRSPWPNVSPGTVAGGGGRELSWELLATLIPVLGVQYLEAERPGASIFVRYPILWGFAYQNLGGGFILPIYYLVLLLTSEPRSAVPSHRGEAVFAGILFGYGIPTLGMLFLNDPRWTLAWQFFPFTIAVAREVWALLRPAQAGEDPGFGDFWARTTQGLGVVIGTIAHVAALLEAAELDSGYARMWTAYARTFLPVLDVPTPDVSAEGYLWLTLANFLKWDWIFIFVSTYAAALCAISQTRTTRAWKELLDPGTWGIKIGAFILMGPAALLSGTWMWRDDILWEEREGKRI